MYAVCVDFRIQAGKLEQFMVLMKKQAVESLAEEPACRRFDICTDQSRSNEVFLYEIYDDEAAFQLHLASPHFRHFDAAAAEMVATKSVTTYGEVIA